jgi:glycosyltransferase involved in cell wall biosynthesis
MSSVSIIVPAYNEEESVSTTLADIKAALGRQPIEYEIIVVDDGSTDGTADAAQQEAGVRLIQHHTNRGYGAALKTGIRQARYDWIAIIDADGTYPPEALPTLLQEMERCDMVVGARPPTEIAVVRRPAKWLLSRLAEYMAETPIPDLNSGMRVFRKDIALGYFNILPSAFSFTITITLAFLSDHYLVSFVPIPYHRRTGASKIRPVQDTMNFVQIILRTVMYFNPLKVLLPVSFVLFLIAFAIGMYSLVTQGRVMDITVITITMAALEIAVVAMIADMIQKRNRP